MGKLRVAVIGAGHLGSIHAKLYKELSSCELTAICDINQTRLTELSAALGVYTTQDYKSLFGKIDAASVAVPTNQHYKVAFDLLNHGIPVLVEKPFTTNLPEADALIRLAKKKKLLLQVGHVERFNSAFAATKKLINEPKFIECHRLSPFPNRSLDVGVVLDLMIHDLDIVLGLVNSPVKKLEAVGINVLTKFEDIANARIEFKNGCVCNLTASRVSDEWLRKIRIFLKNTYISLDYKHEEAFVYRKTPQGITKEALPIEKEQPLKRELNSFIDSIIQSKPPLVTGEEARASLAIALQICKIIWRKQRIY
ncbi:MAG: gfo/Idh/MocA family oxidoreductase [Candidatus Omnitrophota bacterium]|jgi:predicted dehydrogenase|nr:MAG: gfo/Idh/MocA family oxidoreductase [Candidatus Omnitrophota bacterium]